MPKRGKNRGWGTDNSGGRGYREVKYYEHDDRGFDTRRVSFKPSGNRVVKNKRKELAQIFLEHEDVDMSGPSGSGRTFSRFNPYNSRGRGFVSGRGGRRGGRVDSPAPQYGRRKLKDMNGSWFQVILPYGSKYGRDYILKTLLNYVSPLSFVPVGYMNSGKDSVFHIEGYEVAEKLNEANRQITTNDGFKLGVRVRPGLPHVEINQNVKEKLKQAMGRRFSPATNALDLTKFHEDPELVDSMVAALCRPNMILGVIDIIAENIPRLGALNLSENRIQTLEHFGVLSKKLPNLTVLHMGRNRIREINQLNYLEGLQLVDLMLAGNPVCDKYEVHSIYVGEVRKRFPKVVKLDGVDLPPPILFEDDSTVLPTSKQSFLCSELGGVTAKQFLEQYFQLYDTENRRPLIDAYHNKALFSLTCTYPPGNNTGGTSSLSTYMPHSRNLIRIKLLDKRQSLIKYGKESIISFLSQLPRTEHDLPSFKVSLPVFTPQAMILSISGLFREPGPKRDAVRSFTRTFFIVPVGSGFCIANEQYYVTNATTDQLKVAFKKSLDAPPAPTPTPVPQPVEVGVDHATKQQMVQTLAAHSGMNIDWSAKCLHETNWDFQKAVSVFTDLHSKGVIPPEAFITQ